MALTKVTKSGLADNSVDAAKLVDGTVVAADINDGTITAAKLNSTVDLSSKTVTLPNTSVTNAQLAGSIANAKLANNSITVNGTAVALGSSTSILAFAWQSVVTSNTTMVSGRGYFVNTTSGAITMTLPASPSAGDYVAIKDYAATFQTNNLTIARNGSNIQGNAANSQIDTTRASVVLVYSDATKGWLYTNESNVADLQAKEYVTATGGTVANSGDFKIHTFNSSSNFVVSLAGNSLGSTKVDYLVIAGGGGGGFNNGGGGGAGGYRESKSPVAGTYTASPLASSTAITAAVQTYPISVGAAGSGGPNQNSTAGSNSVFSTITSAGGGRGGNDSGGAGGNGGSGGGGGYNGPAGSGNTPPVSPSQGFNGGGSAPLGGGGGGGAAGQGSAASGSNGGAGGNGTPTAITGSAVTRAGGGGGGADGSSGGGAGPGGGGTGSPHASTPGGAGSSNTGSGGGGGGGASSPSTGGNGGSGVVVLRYKYQN